MTNQVLDFLDIDLGLYVNNFDSSSLDSSASSSAVNVFSSNPNLTSLVTDSSGLVAAKQHSYFQQQPLLAHEENKTSNAHINSNKVNNKSSFNFQPQVHRTHSYSFSATSPNYQYNTAQVTQPPPCVRSSSQLLNTELNTTKKAILKHLDKKTPSYSKRNEQKQILSKSMQPQQSTVYSQLNHQQIQPMIVSLHSSVSSSSNVSPSSNSSICSSTSSSNDNQGRQLYNTTSSSIDMSLSSTRSSKQLDSQPVTPTADDNLPLASISGKKPTKTTIMDYVNQFDELTTTVNNSQNEPINQLEFPPTTFVQPQQQHHYHQQHKKKPLLLPKPAPITAYSTLIIPSVTQTPFISNSQISMMIPTIANGIISRSNSQPDLTITNLDANFSTDMIVNSNHTSFNANFNVGNNGMSSQQLACLEIKNRPKVIRRHPSLSYKPSMAEYNEQDEAFMGNFFTNLNNSPFFNNNNNDNNNIGYISANSETNQGTLSGNGNMADDGLFLGTDALSDFINNCGAITDLFEDLPDLEDLMSLVTFESSSTSSATALSSSG